MNLLKLLTDLMPADKRAEIVAHVKQTLATVDENQMSVYSLITETKRMNDQLAKLLEKEEEKEKEEEVVHIDFDGEQV